MMYKIEVSLSEILKIFSKNHKTGDISLIQEAYGYAEGKHQGVKRATGEPYICHPLRVARFIAEWGFEMDVIIAALLHDVVEDCGTPLSEIEEYFGPEAASTVDAVTKLSDRDFADRTLTKEQKDILSDAHMQKKMNDK
ncbi:MAG: HD domain-containing protein, partial [Blautia sp.]|nr:HD domain-containing protein [Blautia sp.]